MSDNSTEEMSVEKRYALIRSVGEECIQENELENLISKKPNIRCYDGFEPSGRMHIAQGIFKAINVNKCTQSGCEFVFWVADWFALMNDKVGGELDKIRVVGEYLIEVWKAAGMNMEKVHFLWSSKEITDNAEIYWKMVIDVARRNTIARIKKCCTIMGKQEGTLTAAQILYPLMQCTDIFFLKSDICQLGLDQRKVNMLAREYCDLIKRKLKPVILSHHMLAGLKPGQAKMSKSDPDSAIFMEDSAEDVARKIRQAYCPRILQKATEVTDDGAPVANEDKNPVLDYFQHIIYSRPGGNTSVDGIIYETYEELEAAFLAGSIAEESLKEALIVTINSLLEPVRQHFINDPNANKLLELVKSYRSGGKAQPLATIAPPQQSPTPLAVIWMPVMIKFPRDLAISISSAIKEFLHKNSTGEVVLLLPDWTALACSEVTGEEKYINAAIELNLSLLKSHWLPTEGVRIVRQSEIILQNPNEYWITAINVGRRNLLQRVEEVCGELKSAGHLLAALMYTADTAILKATHIISTSRDGGYHEIITQFFDNKLSAQKTQEGVIPPLHRPDATIVGPEDILFIDDSENDIRRKMKKAYCAPNESENPVIAVAAWVIEARGNILIERPEINGGNVNFNNSAELREAAHTGALHPGDLKEAVTKILKEECAATTKVLTSPEGKKYALILRNAEKSLSNKSK